MSDDAADQREGTAADESDGTVVDPTGDEPDETTDQSTVMLGSDGFQPDADDPTGTDESAGTTAGLEDAIPAAEGAFDWRGWLLVAVIVVSFLVLPVLVTLRPLRIAGFRTTYLLLPLVPAVLLGATAVWVAVRSRQ